MKRLALFIILLCFAGCTETQAKQVTITCTWTAVGDDGNVGTAYQYRLAYLGNDSTFVNETDSAGNPIGGNVIYDIPAPKPAGSAESYTFTKDLPYATYYFCLWVQDEAGNWSQPSNIAVFRIDDSTPPAAILDFKLTVEQ